MKNVFLKSIKLYFFKGTKNRTVEFTGHETNIEGPNGSGKTTVFDAFTWLLFGKDSHDKKDFNIKTLNENNVNVEKVDHTVEGVLSVDGTDFNIKRIFRENWVKKRGSLEPELKGHETLFYINDVPRKAGEYATEISEIIDESVFKLITNPKYFANLNWKNQREILFAMVGAVSDAEIANGNEDFEALLYRLSGKDIEKYKIEISSKKNKLKEDLDAIPTRVDEAERSKPEIADFSEAENKISELNKEVQSIDNALESASEAFSEKHKANQEVLKQINDLKSEQQKVVFDAKNQAQQDFFNAQSKKRELEGKISDSEGKIRSLKNSLSYTEKSKAGIIEKRDGLREKYDLVFKSTFTEEEGKLTCPVFQIVCDSPKANELHKTNSDKARETFNQKRVDELANINKQGAEFNEEIKNHDCEIENVNSDIEAEETKITQLKNDIASLPKAEQKEIIPAELQDHVNLQYQINILDKKLIDVEAPNNSALKENKTNLLTEIDSLKKVLAGKDQIERTNERIAELNQIGRNLAQQIADLENDENTIDAFNKAKIEECESRVNGRFELVKFKLFNQQLNGGESETCEILISGVPYSDANTASQINAGLDVINVLSKFHGVSAPIFIDGRESVTRIINTDSQVVNLIVSDTKELVIN